MRRGRGLLLLLLPIHCVCFVYPAYDTQVMTDYARAYWRFGGEAPTVTVHPDFASLGDFQGVATGHVRGGLPTVGTLPGYSSAFCPADASSVVIPFNPYLNDYNAFGVEVWAKVTGGQGTDRYVVSSAEETLIPAYDSYGNPLPPTIEIRGYSLRANANNRWEFVFADSSSTEWSKITSPFAVVVGQWVHLAARFDAGAYGFFVNAESIPDSLSSMRTGFMGNFGRPMVIGASGLTSQGFFNGNVDAVAYYGAPVPSDTVWLNHYNLALQPVGDVTQSPGQCDSLSKQGRGCPFTTEFEVAGASALSICPTQQFGYPPNPPSPKCCFGGNAAFVCAQQQSCCNGFCCPPGKKCRKCGVAPTQYFQCF